MVHDDAVDRAEALALAGAGVVLAARGEHGPRETAVELEATGSAPPT